MKRATEVCPELTNGKGPEALSVIRHGVGLRPVRRNGPRIEKERISTAGSAAGVEVDIEADKSNNHGGRGVWVVHCYGHGGYGYQSSYGSAYRVVDLVRSIVGGWEWVASGGEKARL